jgi:ABC-2 type transport system permease protein
MTGLLRAELFKLRTTRTTVGLTAAMLGLLCLVVLVHGFALSAASLSRTGQMHVFGLSGLGVLFAALLGALSITGELRTGTIRPTLLTTPQRGRVLVAKLATSAAAGAGYGIAAAAVTIGLAIAALSARGIPVRLDGSDYTQLVLGDTAAAALWAVLGLGIGALLRNQVATLVGLCAWLLFIEQLLLGQLPSVVRYFPGTAAAAISGSTITGDSPSHPGLLTPLFGMLLLAGYAAASTVAGVLVTDRRDVP